MQKKNTQTTPKKKVIRQTSPKKVTKGKSAENVLEDNIQLSANTASVTRDDSANAKKPGPVAFSIDDIEALVATRGSSKKTRGSSKETEAPGKTARKKKATVEKKAKVEEMPIEKRVLGAASLSDILGFNPAERTSPANMDESSVPKKWKKYYKLLIKLREELSEEISLHTSNTLQHHLDDQVGDQRLEDDAGTDAFDRDFALSLVSSEQEALNEIEEALLRIKRGTYGVCEVTGQVIAKDRLTAVPFARYSVEGQIEFEKNKRREIDRSAGGLFADASDAPSIAYDDGDEN